MLIDTHCHVTDARFANELEAVLARAHSAGVQRLITIGTGLADAQAAITLAQRFPQQIAASVGIEPFSAHEALDHAQTMHALHTLISTQRAHIVAIGEFGFEWHHDLGDEAHQAPWVDAQLALALRCALPVILHARSGRGRNAHADMLCALDRHPGVRGVIHSFDGDAATARAYAERGLHVAVNGMVTFKANQVLRAALHAIPRERLLLETDSPYLSPEPLRGRRNEPAHIQHVAACVSRELGVPLPELCAQTTANARAAFQL